MKTYQITSSAGVDLGTCEGETEADDRDGCHSCHSLAPVAGLLCAECGHAVERHGATVADAYAVECDCDAHLHDTLAATHAAHDGDCDCAPAAIVECGYCGAEVNADYDAPGCDSGEWATLATLHHDGCEWIATRAHATEATR